MVHFLQIAQLRNPILRQQAKEVTSIYEKETQDIIDDLIATSVSVDGVGLSAPQVYQSLQLFVVTSHPTKHYPKAPNIKPLVFINPTILNYSKNKNTDWEGCLSIPGIRGRVSRHTSVTVEFTNRFGKKEKKLFLGFISRVIQHEYDHLHGMVFIDRIKK